MLGLMKALILMVLGVENYSLYTNREPLLDIGSELALYLAKSLTNN